MGAKSLAVVRLMLPATTAGRNAEVNLNGRSDAGHFAVPRRPLTTGWFHRVSTDFDT